MVVPARRKATKEEHERLIPAHYPANITTDNPLVAIIAVYRDGTEIEYGPEIMSWEERHIN